MTTDSEKLKPHKQKCSLLISSLSGGGAEGVCVTVANGLAELGWQVELVVLHLNDAVHLARVSDQVTLVNLNVLQARYVFKPLRQYLRIAAPDKVLAFNYELTMATVLIRGLYGFKFDLIARNINTISRNMQSYGRSVKGRIFSILLKSLYKKADFVINQSQGMQQDLLACMPQFAGRCSVINNPVSPIYEHLSDDFLLSDKAAEHYILCVGRLEQQKAFHQAISAFSEIAAEFPLLRLKFVGKGSLEQALQLQAQQLGIADRVDFAGFHQQLLPFYKNAQLTLLTSLYEGFPNVLVESISCGTAVVSVDCPSGPAEIIQPGINGALVRKGDSIAQALRTVLQQPCYTDALKVKATALTYTQTMILQQYEQILTGLDKNGL